MLLVEHSGTNVLGVSVILTKFQLGLTGKTSLDLTM